MSVCSIRFSSVVAPQSLHARNQPVQTALSRPRVAPQRLAHPAAPPLLHALRRPRPCRAQGHGDAPRESFSHRLFMDTFDYHQEINRHRAMGLLRDDNKVTSARIYWRMLVDKLAFHEALEVLLARYQHEPLLDVFRAPTLARAKRLRHDLHALSDKAHARVPKPAPASEAVRNYIEAMQLAARRDPRALAAHAWLHYLGDMHGGQIMRGRLAERHGADTVTAFEFSESVDHLKRIYGQALDVPLSDYEKRLLKEQAIEVYTHSLKMHDFWVNP